MSRSSMSGSFRLRLSDIFRLRLSGLFRLRRSGLFRLRRCGFLLTLCGALAAPLATASLAADGVIVFGGAGRTGAFVVDNLLAQGEEVTVFVRPTSDRSRLAGKDVAYAVGDAMRAADVDAAFAAAKPRVAINTMGGRDTPKNFWDTTQMNITAAAKKHGTEEIIFLSSVGVGDSAMAYSEEARARTKDSMAERFAAEEDLKASGLTYVIIRTGIIAPEGTGPTGKAELTEDRMSLGAVTRTDLAEMTVACMGNDACANMTFAAEDNSLMLMRE